MGGIKAHYHGIVAFSQTDFTPDLKKITVPTLAMHGDDDQIVPYAHFGPLSAKLVKNGTLKITKGVPHGMLTTQADTINRDLLGFIRGRRLRTARVEPPFCGRLRTNAVCYGPSTKGIGETAETE
jgi:pimeloyl-ACP methyl ester carboxylesterase